MTPTLTDQNVQPTVVQRPTDENTGAYTPLTRDKAEHTVSILNTGESDGWQYTVRNDGDTFFVECYDETGAYVGTL